MRDVQVCPTWSPAIWIMGLWDVGGIMGGPLRNRSNWSQRMGVLSQAQVKSIKSKYSKQINFQFLKITNYQSQAPVGVYY
ncbi:hypothetical protein C0J52_20796 [Blattella germanica]|nr:hypothetical protein C0J52_20796 [Blattella germanica]